MKKGFTLAEVLITLTIIGIVAAIVVPSLINEISDKAWSAKRAALYSRMSNALANMEKLNGYGEYTPAATSDETTIDTASESFIVDGLSKFYKIKRVCGSDNFSKCGPKYKFTNAANSSVSFPTDLKQLSQMFSAIRPTSFETNNGELMVAYYNPNCNYTRSDATSIIFTNTMCVNFIYDLNGAKAPNQFGKDMGVITAFYGLGNTPEVVMPIPVPSYKSPITDTSNASKKSYSDAISSCEDIDDNYALPDIWELASMFLNRNLINANVLTGYAGIGNDNYWSSSAYSAGQNGKAWYLYVSRYGLGLSTSTKSNSLLYYCTQKQ